MPVAYLPEQDRFRLSCSAARKLPVKVFFKKWQGQYDLNSQPTVLEIVALPVELYPLFALKQKSTVLPRRQPKEMTVGTKHKKCPSDKSFTFV